MTFLKVIAQAEIYSVNDLNEFFMTDKLTETHLNDIKALKKWIEEDTNCLWFIEEVERDYDLQGYHIIQYQWDEDLDDIKLEEEI